MPFDRYLDAVARKLETGDATEHSYRADLGRLLEALGADDRRSLTALNEPKRIACGAPDYVLRRGAVTVGYVEAKDVGKDLGAVETGDQLARYRKALSNLVLTDYLEFRHYVGGEHRATARLADVVGGRLRPVEGGVEAVRALLTDALARDPEPVRTASALADRMARLARMVHDVALEAVRSGAASETLRDLRDVIAQTLVPDVASDDEQFVDMYAQTLAYGLFAARVHHGGPGEAFTRHAAAAAIPKTNPLLRRLFSPLTGPSLDDEPHAGFVTDLVALLARADLRAVLEDFGKQTRSEDPVVHFYESFLKAYDPKLRVDRGVFYTPAPVVRYIVRSVDALLKREFGLPGGLQDTAVSDPAYTPPGAARPLPKVLLLDPACGTGTFLYHVVDFLRQRFVERGQGGLWKGFVGEELLPRLHGFELLMAPYAVAHLKLGLQLAAQDLPPLQREAFAYEWDTDERLKVFLTNTLEEAEREVPTVFGPYRALADETHAANRVKTETPVLVVLGNPPYAGESANAHEEEVALKKGTEYVSGWGPDPDLGARPRLSRASKDGTYTVPTEIGRLVRDYFYADGADLGERNTKWLQDDYVKFVRWAEHRIEQTGQGVVAFITNHGFLDNPTFRGMRYHLLRTFSAVYVLDLHGNLDKGETTSEGERDDNVFDIKRGVAVTLLIKREGDPGGLAEVYRADLWGRRREKYDWLGAHDVTSTEWERVEPQAPRYLFLARDRKRVEEYEQGQSLPESMPLNSAGIVTARDALTVHFSDADVWATVQDFAALAPETARATYGLKKDARDWKVHLAQADLRESGPARERIVNVLYRPFDVRSTYYTGHSRGFHCMPRGEVMRHMIAGPNLGLVWTRPMSPTYEFSVLVTDGLIDQCAVGNKSAGAGISYLGPLYRYPAPERRQPDDLFSTSLAGTEPGGSSQDREPNLSPPFVAALETATGLAFVPDGTGDLDATVGPESVLHYAYAVFHSPAYRERYADLLRIDFPRLPLTSDADLFRQLCALGARLVGLHLLRDVPAEGRPDLIGQPLAVEAGYPVYVPPGAPIGKTLAGAGAEAAVGRVYLNPTAYVEGVAPGTWAAQVGGYQPLEKWLKDRRGRTLTFSDVEHYVRTAAALHATRALMAEIDAAVEAAGGFPLS